MATTLMSIVDPGDEVIVFEPFYENYGPDAILCDAHPVYVPLPVTGRIDLERLAAAFSERTRAIIVNSPNNPAGSVYGAATLAALGAALARKNAGRERPVFLVSDEPYRALAYDGVTVPPVLPVRLSWCTGRR